MEIDALFEGTHIILGTLPQVGLSKDFVACVRKFLSNCTVVKRKMVWMIFELVTYGAVGKFGGMINVVETHRKEMSLSKAKVSSPQIIGLI